MNSIAQIHERFFKGSPCKKPNGRDSRVFLENTKRNLIILIRCIYPKDLSVEIDRLYYNLLWRIK